LGAEKARQLDLVYKSAHRLLGRVDALTEFFRLQAGAIGSEADWFSPRQLIEETLARFRQDAGEKGVDLQIGPGPLPSRIRCPQKLVSRVLRELVYNAVRFTDSGAVRVEMRLEANRAAWRVSDAGPGLGAGGLQQLAGALGQADTYQGLGLGLALSRLAAGLLGGRIEVESLPGKGSAFTLVFEVPLDNLEM